MLFKLVLNIPGYPKAILELFSKTQLDRILFIYCILKANIMKIGKTTVQLARIQRREHASLNKSDTYATMTPRGE